MKKKTKEETEVLLCIFSNIKNPKQVAVHTM